MKSRYFDYLFLCVFEIGMLAFWLFLYSGHLTAGHFNCYFDTSFDFFYQTFSSQRLLCYVGNFLYLFFKWEVAGAFIMTIPVLSVFFISRLFLKELFFSKTYSSFAFLPAVLLFVFQQSRQFLLDRSLFVVLLFLLGYVYLKLRGQRKLRYFFSTFFLIFPICFFQHVELALYYSMIGVIELFCAKNRWRFFSFVYFIPAFYFLYVYFQVKDALTNFGELYVEKIIWFPALCLLALCCGCIPFFKKEFRTWLYVLIVLVIAVSGCFFGRMNDEEAEFEKLIRLYKAVWADDMEKVLLLTESEKKEISGYLPFAVYAHARKGELPDKMFDYPLNSNTYLLTSAKQGKVVASTFLNIFFFKHMGLMDEAIHDAFLLSTSPSNGETMMSLYLLADLNIQKGDYLLAEKYLCKLERTIVNKGWVKERREKLLTQSAVEQTPVRADSRLFFIDSAQEMNLFRLLLDNPKNAFARDCFFCTLLQRREYNLFCESFSKLYTCDKITFRLPILFQEALFMAQEVGLTSFKDSTFSASVQIRKDWQEFSSVFNDSSIDSCSKTIRLRKFKNTWWYYCLMSPEKIR